MKINRLVFSIDIMAERTKIWQVLWNEESYRNWASVFSEGSYFNADSLKEGSKVLFLSPDLSGIYSLVETHIPNDIIQFRHVGVVLNGKEQPIDDEVKKWSGTTEIYSIIEGSDSNTLTIEIDVLDEHLDFMSNKLPEALEKIKSLCIKQ